MTSNESRARKLAARARRDYGTTDGPIKDLFEFAHLAAGVDVLSLPAGEEEHGLSMLDPASGRAVIAVATTPHPMRQRSSIAHELGHVLAGDLEGTGFLEPGRRTPEEIRADAFARHLLVPVDGVGRRVTRMGSVLAEPDLSDLVQEYEASPALVAIQLRDLGFIDLATYERWCRLSTARLATAHGWRNQYQGLVADSNQPRAPQGLMERAVEGYRTGALGLQELARWYGQAAEELVDELGEPELPTSEELLADWDDDAPLFPETTGGADR